MRLCVAQVTALAVAALAFAGTRVVGADVDPRSKWVTYENKKLGIAFKHPANAKVEVKGAELHVSGPELATLTITVEDTKERTSSKRGGQSQKVVDWTIAVPKRAAHCHAEADDLDMAVLASSMCDALDVTPGAREPHVEIAVTSSGLADADAFEKAVRAKAKTLDACWTSALRKDPNLTEGQLTLKRTFDDGKPSNTIERAENFFDRDTKALATCAFAALESVPVKTAEKDASIKVSLVCLFY